MVESKTQLTNYQHIINHQSAPDRAQQPRNPATSDRFKNAIKDSLHPSMIIIKYQIIPILAPKIKTISRQVSAEMLYNNNAQKHNNHKKLSKSRPMKT